MGGIENRRDSKHDINVGNRRYSAKMTLTHFIAQAKLDKITKIPLARMLSRAIRRSTKNYKNFNDAITRTSPRQ